MAISVKYIGKRKTYKEGAYGSNIDFVQGQSYDVPDVIAIKLLKHPDVYVKGDSVAIPAIVEESVIEDTQDLRDSIMQMEADALINMASNDYGRKLDKRKTVDNLRSEVIALVDQFGAV